MNKNEKFATAYGNILNIWQIFEQLEKLSSKSLQWTPFATLVLMSLKILGGKLIIKLPVFWKIKEKYF